MNLTTSAERELRRRELSNCLATISNILWAMQHRPHTWDEKIKALEEIKKIMPLAIRYLLYFKNVEEKKP